MEVLFNSTLCILVAVTAGWGLSHILQPIQEKTRQ